MFALHNRGPRVRRKARLHFGDNRERSAPTRHVLSVTHGTRGWPPMNGSVVRVRARGVCAPLSNLVRSRRLSSLPSLLFVLACASATALGASEALAARATPAAHAPTRGALTPAPRAPFGMSARPDAHDQGAAIEDYAD